MRDLCENPSGSNNLRKKPGADLGKEGGLEAQWSRVLGRVHATIERNEKRLAEQDRRERMEFDWKQVALVSDRALLCVFFFDDDRQHHGHPVWFSAKREHCQRGLTR